MRLSVYFGSSGGTLILPFLSDVSMSALPLPCAIHVPPHASMTGSRAVMTPLAGTDHSILFFVFACTYGSRFVSTKMDRFLRYVLMNSLSRSGVHGESIFSRRMRASSLAAWRAWRKLVVTFDISPTSGSGQPALGTVPLESPLRTARSDSTSCDIERKKTHRTRIKMAPAKR